MTIELNGEPYELVEGTSVGALVDALSGSRRGTAVVVGDDIVPRSSWDSVRLADGDAVEIITATQGG